MLYKIEKKQPYVALSFLYKNIIDRATQRRKQLTRNMSKNKGQTPKNKNKRGNHCKNDKVNNSPKVSSFEGFDQYWSLDLVSHSLKRGELIQGRLRINPKNFEDAYIPEPDGTADIYISGVKNRNRALDTDIVAVQILPRPEWRVWTDAFDKYFNISKLENGSTDQASVSSQFEKMSLNKPQKNSQADGATVTPGGGNINSPCGKSQSETSTPNKDNKGNSCQKRNNGARQSAMKKYTSLEDVVRGNDAVVRRLFSDSAEKAADGGPCGFSGVPDHLLQRTAKVVYIIERKHSCACSGFLKQMPDKNPNMALFSPMDHRLPRLHVAASECPPDFMKRPADFATTLFIARIAEWSENNLFPKGQLMRSLGEAGQIEPETEGMLTEYGIDYAEFPQKALDCLPKNLPWTIPEKEFEYRRDFRKSCVFTIDPATARDLDDALSVEEWGDGIYKVGVHIADVSFFLTEDTALDQVAQSRATSVYLVQKVIPMLPRLLCEQLCSLNPDEDRLTFSVEWTMTETGEILDEWFGRSVIRSCAKLSYDHAQGFIEDPDKSWTREELPAISEGFSIEDIRRRTLNLNKIAVNLRKRRFDDGALQLTQTKLMYTLDKETGLPSGYKVYEQKDSNRLVEEFMLLANMAVAHKIYGAYPAKALLRRHPTPQSKMMDDLVALCASMGIPIDADSAGALNRSLSKYCDGDDNMKSARLQILTSLCSKPMQLARYFCTGSVRDEDLFRHYALNVPLYTHFTSPIRRYPDVMVHRLLAASLGYSDEPSMDTGTTQAQAEHCNDKKNNAKRVSEQSSDMFFSIFVKECGPLEEQGMVMGVMDHSFDVLILKLGVIKRVYTNKLPLKDRSFRMDHKRPELTLIWEATNERPEVTQVISIFTQVHCVLQADNQPLKWMASIKHPLEQLMQY